MVTLFYQTAIDRVYFYEINLRNLLYVIEIKDCRPELLWQHMSYIEQDVFLFDTSILDNITLGEDFTEDQIRKALRDSALDKDLSFMPDGLHTVVGENGCRLSGGQKQRIAIARAMLHDRSILWWMKALAP